MVHIPEKYERPTIKIYRAPGWAQQTIRYLLEGIEEEGLPSEVEDCPGGDIFALAYEAAGASRLGVGIAADGQQVILHHDKLDQQKPLFCIPASAGVSTIRALGANAARLVKKMPFKSI